MKACLSLDRIHEWSCVCPFEVSQEPFLNRFTKKRSSCKFINLKISSGPLDWEPEKEAWTACCIAHFGKVLVKYSSLACSQHCARSQLCLKHGEARYPINSHPNMDSRTLGICVLCMEWHRQRQSSEQWSWLSRNEIACEVALLSFSRTTSPLSDPVLGSSSTWETLFTSDCLQLWDSETFGVFSNSKTFEISLSDVLFNWFNRKIHPLRRESSVHGKSTVYYKFDEIQTWQATNLRYKCI